MGKLLILSAALDHPAFFWVLAAVLLSGLLMIIAVARSGSLLFYNTLPNETCHTVDGKPVCDAPKQLDLKGLSSVVVLLSVAVLLVVFAKPVHTLTDAIAEQWAQPWQYQTQVLNVETRENSYKELVE